MNHTMRGQSLWPGPPSHSILWGCMTCVVALESYLRNPASTMLTLITSITQTSHGLLMAFQKKSSVKTRHNQFHPEYLALRKDLPKDSTATEMRSTLCKQLQALIFDCVCHSLQFNIVMIVTHSLILLGIPFGQNFWRDDSGCPCRRCSSTRVT